MTATINPGHKVVLIKIPRSAPAEGDADALKEATSKWWVVAESRRDGGPASPDYALAVVGGRVAVAYRIAGWQPAPTGSRWGFTGEISPELTSAYRGLDVTGYFRPGAANPLRYVNCDTPVTRSKRATSQAVEAQRSELSDVAARLKKEPLTHLMFGHRELFHSNLLAWFFDCLPEAADEVFGSLTASMSSSSPRLVAREKDHMDLRFSWPDRRPLVIENKVFSLPDDEQLAKYAEGLASAAADPACWLLSLTDPGWTDGARTLGGRQWRWISYAELAKAIRGALQERSSSYEVETMRHYADVVELLTELVANAVVTDADETVALPVDVSAALGDDRLGTTVAKLRSQSVAQRVSQALDKANSTQTKVECGLSHSFPAVSWFAPIDLAPEARAGWQLQEGQFRLAMVLPHLAGRKPEERKARFEFAKKHEAVFDFSALDDLLDTTGQTTQPVAGPPEHLGFNRFDPDFVYRYKKVGAISVAQLEAVAVAIALRFK